MITFLGDVVLTKSLKSEYTPTAPYVFNCEYVIGDSENLMPVPNKINIVSKEYDFASVFSRPPIAVGVCNNHIFDYGESGYRQTIDTLKDENIGIVGEEPFWISDKICALSFMALKSDDAQNKRISFEYSKANQEILNIRKEVPDATIIVMMHWGIENHPCQSQEQTKIAHWLIDNGVDLIIGHHPHCIQPIEIYKDKYIFYSLGNCLFPNISQPSHYSKEGIATRVYRFKWQKWNRKSLAVVWNQDNNQITVDELYQKKNCLYCKRKNVSIKKYIKTSPFSSFVYVLRKYFLFFISNVFVDGKLFDMKAIKAERSKTK